MTAHVGKVAETSFADVDNAADPSAHVRYLEYVTAQMPEYKQKSFQTLHLMEGMRVLDAGCGAGDDARAIAAIVGPAGSVVGLDSSATMVETARTRTPAESTTIEFVHGSLYDLPFPDASFDAARSDRVFQHLGDPERALRELMRVTKPEGRINVVDPDFGGMLIDTENRDLLARLDAFSRRARKGNPGSPWMGRKLWGLFNAAGLQDIHIEADFLWTTELEVANQISDVINWARQAHGAGDATLDEVHAWEAELTERARESRFFGGAPIISVVGIVP